jgi:hypothetical protein
MGTGFGRMEYPGPIFLAIKMPFITPTGIIPACMTVLAM